jgi:hypothetical protein
LVHRIVQPGADGARDDAEPGRGHLQRVLAYGGFEEYLAIRRAQPLQRLGNDRTIQRGIDVVVHLSGRLDGASAAGDILGDFHTDHHVMVWVGVAD